MPECKKRKDKNRRLRSSHIILIICEDRKHLEQFKNCSNSRSRFLEPCVLYYGSIRSVVSNRTEKKIIISSLALSKSFFSSCPNCLECLQCHSRARSTQKKTRLSILLCPIVLRGYVFSRWSDKKAVTHDSIEQPGKSRGRSVIHWKGIEPSK